MEFLVRTFVHLFHVVIVGGLFLYVGIKNTSTPLFIFPFLKYLGLLIILYHIYKAYLKISVDASAWVNYIHIFLVGPLLLVIGSNGVDTSRKYFEMLLMAGMASIGYHGYYLFV